MRVLKVMWHEVKHNWAMVLVGAIIVWIIFSGVTRIIDNQFSLLYNQEEIYKQCKPFTI